MITMEEGYQCLTIGLFVVPGKGFEVGFFDGDCEGRLVGGCV